MKKQGPRTRALNSRGKPVPGLYVRDGKFIAGYQHSGEWRMQTLKARTLTEAKRERASLVSGLREGRIAISDGTTFAEVFAEWQDSRSLSERTEEYEQYLLDRYLPTIKGRRVQTVTPSEVARLLRDMRASYSGWTCSHVYRLLSGTFALALRRGLLTRSPMDGLSASERPRPRNARTIERLDAARLERLLASTPTERWKAAIALAGIAGLRLGEVRGLKWGDVSFEENALDVSRSLLPNGTPKGTKSKAGERTVALFPELRNLLLKWKVRSPRTDPEDYVVCTHNGAPMEQRNLRRALQKAKNAAGLEATEGRLSWHSLRHSAGSIWLTEYGLPVTTVSAMLGHANPSFTLACYGRDPRDRETMVADVLARAAAATS
jgi:integrase